MKSLFILIACLSFNNSYSQIKGVESYKLSFFGQIGEKSIEIDDAGKNQYTYKESLDSIGVNKLWSELNSVLVKNDLNSNKPSWCNSENPYVTIEWEGDFVAMWYKAIPFDKNSFLVFVFATNSNDAYVQFYHESYKNLEKDYRRQVEKAISEQNEIESINGIDHYRFSIAPHELGVKVNSYFDGHYDYTYRETLDSVGINNLWTELNVIIPANDLDPDNPWSFSDVSIDSALMGKGEFYAVWYKINPSNKKEYIAFHFKVNQNEAFLAYYISPLKDLESGSETPEAS